MLLRQYQRAAVDAVFGYLRAGPGNPCVCLPTGSGKSAVLSTICRESVENWGGRILVLTHVRELIEQLFDTLKCVWPEGDVGINSAGIGPRQTGNAVIVAGIQSVFRSPGALGRFDLVLVDECHLLPPDGDGMYQTLLRGLLEINPDLRLVGLTATPYRLDSGLICGPDKLLTEIVYEAEIRDLIDTDFLSPLRGKNSRPPDVSGVHRRGGEFIDSELSDLMSTEEKITGAIAEIQRHCANRKALLVFCCGIDHARMVHDALASAGIGPMGLVTSHTDDDTRDEIIAGFKRREVRCVVNVSVLTVGFDAPHVDAVILLRPTLSPGLYVQMVGRGLRRAEGKEDCLILDLAGNIERHGPIDLIRAPEEKDGEGEGVAPQRTCPQCDEIHHAALRMCPGCGFEYPPPEKAKHSTTASDAAPLNEPYWMDVQSFDVAIHEKKGAEPGAKKTVRVTYRVGLARVSQWICCEHSGFARTKAENWYRSIGGDNLQPTAEHAAQEIRETLLKYGPKEILIRDGETFPEVMDVRGGAVAAVADDGEPPF